MATIPAKIQDQIDYVENLEISYRVLHPTINIKDVKSDTTIKIPFSSLTNKYRDYLSSIITTLTLDDEARLKYMYKPKLASLELYGTTEFWSDLLILNNYTSISEFQPSELKIYNPNKLKTYINEILILEGLID